MRKSYKKITLYLVLMLFVGIVFSSVSYSYQEGSLDINGNSKVTKNSWNIYLSNLQIESNYINNNKINIINKTTKINYKISFDANNQNIKLVFDINNDSLYDLKFNGVSFSGLSNEYINKIKFSYMYANGMTLNLNDTFKSGETNKIIVLVENIDKNEIKNDFDFIMDLNFIQE